MIPVYNVNATRHYSLKSDTDETKTIFTLGYLDPQEEAYLQSAFTTISYGKKKEDEGTEGGVETFVTVDAAHRNIEAVRLKLKGIENFPLALSFTTKHYPFGDRQVVTDEILNAISPALSELGKEIINSATFEELDKKK
jgi:hypothetical protein